MTIIVRLWLILWWKLLEIAEFLSVNTFIGDIFSTSIWTFNPTVCEIEETTQTLLGNHAAHCYYGNIETTGYNAFRKDRKSATVGGGVMIYVHNSLLAERRYDLESEYIEQICLEFRNSGCASMICSCIYRPPDADASFFDYLINSVDSIALENTETHIIGDFNINLVSDASSDSRKLIRLMENQGFYQMQKNATRVTENSSTLIDHHYCTNPKHVLTISSPVFGLSDYNPTILVRKQNANLKVAKQYHYAIIFRPLKIVDVCNLINDLNELSWSVLDTFENNPDEMLSMWITLVFSIVDQHASVKSLRVKSLKKPSWLSDEILNAIKEREELKKRLTCSKRIF